MKLKTFHAFPFLLATLVTGATRADDAVPAGRAIFDRVCMACHQPGGVGMPGLAPALVGTLGYAASDDGKRYLAGVLTQGLSGKITSHGQAFMGAMPTQAAMSDADLADTANYLARDLNGLASAPFQAADFARARAAKASHKELRDFRAKLVK